MSSQIKTSGSIRRRLSVQLVGSAAVLATILFLIVQDFARKVAEESQDNILTASVTSILDSANVQSGEIAVDIPYAALSMLGNVSDDRVFYRIMADDVLLTGYADLPNTEPPAAGQDLYFVTANFKGESVRIVTATRQLSRNDHPISVKVTVAQTQNGRAETLAGISRTASLLGLGFFTISAILAIYAAQTSVRPLQKLAGAVARRGPKDLRPVGSPVPAEMIPLVSSLNSFIKRLSNSLTRSEDFIAEAAHRIRTPLATVRTQAEVALRRVERPEIRKSLKEMIRAIDETSRAAGQLLDHAMVTFRADQLDQESVNLADLVQECVDRFGPVAELKDIQFDLDLSKVPSILGDPILIQNAIQNILDNGVKYSGADQTITVTTQANDGYVEVRVLDRGSGFPLENAERLSERFARGENAAATVGSGLGLTIAKEVAQAHGGDLKIQNRSEGTGACVSLFFPS